MPWRPHGRARVDPDNPQSWAVCDRCGNLWNHSDLAWQYQWMGTKLQNTRELVCPECMDQASEFLKTIILPPDPPPVFNTRPEPYYLDNRSQWTLQALPVGLPMFGAMSSMSVTLTHN